MKELAGNLIQMEGFRSSLNDLVLVTNDGGVEYEPNRPCLACVTPMEGRMKTLIIDTRVDKLDSNGEGWFNWLVHESPFNVYKPFMEVISIDEVVFLAFDCEELNWNALFTFLVAIRELYEDRGMVDRLNALLALKGCTREEAWIISHFISNLGPHSCLNDITIENTVEFVKGGFQIHIGGKFLSRKTRSLTTYVWGGEPWGSDTWDNLYNVNPSKAYRMFQQIIKDKT